MRACLFTEELFPPFDEGYKNFTCHLFVEAPRICTALRLGHGDPSVIDVQVQPNRFLLGGSLGASIRKFRPDILIYVPTKSATTASFIRAKVLKWYASGAPLAMVGLQPREHAGLIRPVIGSLSPDLLYVQSRATADALSRAGIRARTVQAGVDADKFKPVTPEEKALLRSRYGIDPSKRVILHVGHIKEARNVRALADLASAPNTQLVIVGSSSTEQESDLAGCLTEKGVTILGVYIEHIEEVYQMADVYVFPVMEKTAAIEMPLSVLEAMACNLPVVTTRFGGLADCFTEGDGLHFVGSTAELLDRARHLPADLYVNTREKVKDFTWSAIISRFLSEIECSLLRRTPSR